MSQVDTMNPKKLEQILDELNIETQGLENFAPEERYVRQSISGTFLDLADKLLSQGLTLAELSDLEVEARTPENKQRIPIELQCAISFAKSRRNLEKAFENRESEAKLEFKIIIPAFREFERVKPRGEGENE